MVDELNARGRRILATPPDSDAIVLHGQRVRCAQEMGEMAFQVSYIGHRLEGMGPFYGKRGCAEFANLAAALSGDLLDLQHRFLALEKAIQP